MATPQSMPWDLKDFLLKIFLFIVSLSRLQASREKLRQPLVFQLTTGEKTGLQNPFRLMFKDLKSTRAS